MKRLITLTVMLAMTLFAGNARAGIFGGRSCGPAVQPAPVAAPAAVTTARVENGYRSFSYEPAAVYAAPRYVAPARMPVTGAGFHDAGWKIRGL
jgi:hypothetical protein